MHIPDDRFREIVLSDSYLDAAPAVLSIKESEHLHACAVCIDRLGDIARQIFEERVAPASEEGIGDNGHSTHRYRNHF